MNAELVNALETAATMLESAETMSPSSTVEYEIMSARKHIQKAIDWEKSVGKQKDGKI